jgi:hypothetical protein
MKKSLIFPEFKAGNKPIFNSMEVSYMSDNDKEDIIHSYIHNYLPASLSSTKNISIIRNSIKIRKDNIKVKPTVLSLEDENFDIVNDIERVEKYPHPKDVAFLLSLVRNSIMDSSMEFGYYQGECPYAEQSTSMAVSARINKRNFRGIEIKTIIHAHWTVTNMHRIMFTTTKMIDNKLRSTFGCSPIKITSIYNTLCELGDDIKDVIQDSPLGIVYNNAR